MLNIFQKTFPDQDASIEAISGGLSGAELYKVTNDAKTYLLRKERADKKELSLSFYYQYHALASQKELAPKLINSSLKEGWLLTDFVEAPALDYKAFKARHLQVIELIKKIHKLPIIDNTPFIEPLAILGAFWNLVKLQEDIPSSIKENIEVFLKQPPAKRTQKLTVTHNDPNPSNFLPKDEKSLYIIDWENASLGHPFFELAGIHAYLGNGPKDSSKALQVYLERLPSKDELKDYNYQRQLGQKLLGLIFLNLSKDLSWEKTDIKKIKTQGFKKIVSELLPKIRGKNAIQYQRQFGVAMVLAP